MLLKLFSDPRKMEPKRRTKNNLSKAKIQCSIELNMMGKGHFWKDGYKSTDDVKDKEKLSKAEFNSTKYENGYETDDAVKKKKKKNHQGEGISYLDFKKKTTAFTYPSRRNWYLFDSKTTFAFTGKACSWGCNRVAIRFGVARQYSRTKMF